MSRNHFEELLRSLQLQVKKAKGKRTTKAIAFFDITGSTPMKLSRGHTYGTRLSLLHNLICREIAAEHTGTVVKELGDGLFVEFKDPVSACLAAIDIKAAFSKKREY